LLFADDVHHEDTKCTKTHEEDNDSHRGTENTEDAQRRGWELAGDGGGWMRIFWGGEEMFGGEEEDEEEEGVAGEEEG